MIHILDSKNTPELISHLFGVGIPKAKDMLQKTTQCGLYQSVIPLTRSYIVDQLYLQINELTGKWTLENLVSRFKSICVN